MSAPVTTIAPIRSRVLSAVRGIPRSKASSARKSGSPQTTIAGNLRDVYRRIVDGGNDVDLRGGTRTGSILLEEMTIAGD